MKPSADRPLLTRILEKLGQVPMWRWGLITESTLGKTTYIRHDVQFGDFNVILEWESHIFRSITSKLTIYFRDRRFVKFSNDDVIGWFIVDLYEKYNSRSSIIDISDIPKTERQEFLDKFLTTLDSENK